MKVDALDFVKLNNECASRECNQNLFSTIKLVFGQKVFFFEHVFTKILDGEVRSDSPPSNISFESQLKE